MWRRLSTPSFDALGRKTKRYRAVWFWGGFLFAALETIVIWTRIDVAPLGWICLVWTVFLIVVAVNTRTSAGRAMAMNLAAGLAAVGLVEGALKLSTPRNPYAVAQGVTMEGSFAQPHYFIEMPVKGLGYRPRPGLSATAIKKLDGQLVYDARYTVGSDGLRIAPPVPANPALCIIMFGDSLTWGEGVNDQDTVAYRLGVLAGARAKVLNFAFTGYSAHQMLWLAQTGAVRAKAACDPQKPVLAIYETLPNNVGRVAGLRGWDKYGPRYRLGLDGRLHYSGGFDRGDSVLHDHLFIPGPLASQLSRVELYDRILGQARKPDAFDLERFAKVVREAQDRLRVDYPNLNFMVMVWPDLGERANSPDSKTSAFVRTLRSQSLQINEAHDALPGFDQAPAKSLIPYDGHPTADAYSKMAIFLWRIAQSKDLTCGDCRRKTTVEVGDPITLSIGGPAHPSTVEDRGRRLRVANRSERCQCSTTTFRSESSRKDLRHACEGSVEDCGHGLGVPRFLIDSLSLARRSVFQQLSPQVVGF